MTITIKAPAKINWFLEIKGKRPDGFHEIETVMQTVSLFDEITVREADELSLRCDIDLGDPKQNLVYRAAEVLQRDHAPGRGASIELRKQIPHGAGLGGGSSDAANALVALNRLWETNLSNDQLREIAAQVGSDCAFFIEGGSAICTGRGEIVHAIPDIEDMDLVILYPEEVCPTAAVYKELSRHLTNSPLNCYFFHQLPHELTPALLASKVMNRLEQPALRVSARLRDAWRETAQVDNIFVRFVSGSGSSIVFLLSSQQDAVRLAQSLTTKKLGRVFTVKTLSRGAVWG